MNELARLFPGAGSGTPSPNASFDLTNDSLFGSPSSAQSPASAALRSSKPPGIALSGDHSELNVESHNLEAQVPQVSVLSKVKCAYSYYLGDLVAANDLACCYVVREEMIRVLHGDSGEKSLLKGHSRQVFDVRFSPVDPRLLASAGRGGRILVWDLQGQTESPILSLRTEDSAMPDSFPSKLAWHPTKKVLAMAFSNNVVRVVNVEELIKDGSTPVEALVSSLEGESRKIECSAPITDLMFSKANPDVLAVSQQNGNFVLSNWNTGASLWEATGHDGNPMHAVRFIRPAQDGPEILLTGGARCEELKLWNVEERRCMSSVKLVAPPTAGANPFYNHVIPVAGAEQFVLLANAKRKDFNSFHISRNGNSFRFDYAALFQVSVSILSGVAQLNRDGERKGGFSFYCVQTTSVQNYQLHPDMCFSGGGADVASSSSSTTSLPEDPAVLAASTAMPSPAVTAQQKQAPAVVQQKPPAEAAQVVQSAARAFLARKSREAETEAAKKADAEEEEERQAAQARQARLKASQEALRQEEVKEAEAAKKRAAAAAEKAKKAEEAEAAKKRAAEKAKKAEQAAAAAAAAAATASVAKPAPAASVPAPQMILKKKEQAGEEVTPSLPDGASIEAIINAAVAKNLAPLLSAIEKDRQEAKKQKQAEIERQKKFLGVLQNAIEERIPKAVEAAVQSSLERQRKESGDVNAVLTDTVRKCFSDQLVPRLERGVTAALSNSNTAVVPATTSASGNKKGSSAAASGSQMDAELRGELRGAINALMDVSKRVSESVSASHQQALANHTAALNALMGAVTNLSRANSSVHPGGSVGDVEAQRVSSNNSPAGMPPTAQRKKTLLAQIKSGSFNSAFMEVLSLKDLTWVMWLMRKIGDPEVVFSKASLTQAVILSLIQQLGHGFPGDDDADATLQLQWIQSALLVLDVASPDVSPHVHTVLQPLLAKLEKSYPKFKDSPPVQVLFKLVMHVLNSLLR